MAAPDVFRRMPQRLQPVIAYRCIRPAGASWLRPRLADVPMSLGRRVLAAEVLEGAVELSLDDGSKRTVDRVFMGAPAAYSFGPINRFVVGSWYSAPAVARRAAGRRQPPFRVAFPRPARPA